MVSDVKEVLAGNPDHPAYRLYSAHDSNIANWLYQLNPHKEWFGIPYAANIYFEVYKDILNQHWVKALYNGEALELEACDG